MVYLILNTDDDSLKGETKGEKIEIKIIGKDASSLQISGELFFLCECGNNFPCICGGEGKPQYKPFPGIYTRIEVEDGVIFRIESLSEETIFILRKERIFLRPLFWFGKKKGKVFLDRNRHHLP
jgi:hypothetical protein